MTEAGHSDEASRDRAATLARFYDLDLGDDPGDVALYRALARRSGGPILELACGSGRIAVPLALDGHAVTGVDLDATMLERARSAWAGARTQGTGHLEVVEADLLDAALGPRFALAILSLNGLLLMADADRQAAALRSLARHLRPGGLAIVDVWVPAPEDLALYDGRVIAEWVRTDAETGHEVAKLVSARHDPATATVELSAWFDHWSATGGPLERVARVDRLRLVGAAELVRFAADAGLAVEQLASDYELTPFGPGAERVVIVLRLV